jgi:cytochrome c-type biogenesis protein CcmH/NrfG
LLDRLIGPFGVAPLKQSRSSLSLIVVFVAGFVLGVVFSAWKLDKMFSPTVSARPETTSKNTEDDIEKRIAGLETMLAMTPTNVKALMQLANDYFAIGKHEKALEAFQKAQKLDDKNPDIPTFMGVIYRRLGKPQQAANAFKKALEIKPDHTMALFNLGIVYGKELNKPQEELKVWKAFLTTAGDTPHADMVRQRVKDLENKLGKHQ